MPGCQLRGHCLPQQLLVLQDSWSQTPELSEWCWVLLQVQAAPQVRHEFAL